MRKALLLAAMMVAGSFAATGVAHADCDEPTTTDNSVCVPDLGTLTVDASEAGAAITADGDADNPEPLDGSITITVGSDGSVSCTVTDGTSCEDYAASQLPA